MQTKSIKNNLIYVISVIYLIGLLFLGSVSAEETTQAHKNGELVISNGTVYLIKDGKRFGFKTAEEFISHGYTFDMALTANSWDLALPYAGEMTARDGSYVLDTSDGRTLYFIYQGVARPLAHSLFLTTLGLQGRSFFQIDLSSYPKAQTTGFEYLYLSHPSGALIIKSGDSTIFQVTDSGLRPFSAFSVFQSYRYDFSMVLSANLEDGKLPVLQPIEYRNGSLLNDKGTIFLVVDGKKYGFKTWESFVARGYSLNAVIEGDTTGISEGESFQ